MGPMRVSIGAMLVAALLCGGVWAEELQPMRYVSTFAVKPGQGAAFMELGSKYNEPVMKQLMEDGTILGWGVVTPVLHGLIPATHGIWWTCRNYADLGKVMAAFEASEENIPKEDMESFLDTIDWSRHADSLVRSIVFKSKPTAVGTKPYISVAQWEVMPHKGREWLDLWKENIQPTMDKLMEDGTIIAYGVDREEEHTTNPTMRQTWSVFPNLADVDKMEAAFDAAYTEAEWAVIFQQFSEVSDGSAHRDFLYQSLSFATQ